MKADQLHDFIAKLCNEETFEPVEGRWMFKSGGDCGRCTDAALKVAVAFGGWVMGYKCSVNPTAQIGNQYCEGHDFAIIESRYIVDYWAFRVARLIAKPIHDMDNPTEHELVVSLYGNKQTWEAVFS